MTEKKETKTSKFSSLLSAVKEREPEEIVEETPADQPVQMPAAQGEVLTPQAQDEPPRRGRPRGKRSDPGFEQVTAYIGRETHRNVKIALLREGTGREFSELVEELLASWLSQQG